MKAQFEFNIQTTTPAPLVLEPETARAVVTDNTLELLAVPPQPPAKTRADWERRQHGSFRARQMRRNLLRKVGEFPGGVAFEIGGAS